MPRIRTIKPDFWCSEQIVECSPIARLMFVGMWNFADDGGVHPASIKRLKMQIFPGDPFSDADIAGWIDELIRAGLIIEFSAEHRDYWHITGWHHQKIDRPSFKYPRRVFDEYSTNDRRMIDERSPPEKEKEKEKEKEVKLMSTKTVDDQAAIEEFFSAFAAAAKNFGWRYPQKLTKGRRSKIRVRLKEAYFRDNWPAALDRGGRSGFLRGASGEGGWRANIDWFVRPDSVLAILEGKYDDTGNGKPYQPPSERQKPINEVKEEIWQSIVKVTGIRDDRELDRLVNVELRKRGLL